MGNAENELKLSKFLLQKYADIINERERRTIGEIKELVDGKDLSIQSLVQDFRGAGYSFKENYFEALKKVFELVKNEIEFVDADLGINYWLTAKEVLEARSADDEDLAVFLCAAMKALGDDSAEVIIAELDDLKTHAFVATTLPGKDPEQNFLILDPAQGHEIDFYKGTKADVLKKYSFQKQKIKRFLYRFNSEKYEQFLE